MYLIAVEGGDGSGKGTAARLLAAEARREFTFSDVWLTEEPQRDSQLGGLAVESVRTDAAKPEREAVLFAADRLDHGHTVILPRLAVGELVVSERSVTSSLVYQGVVGGLGVERVAQMNAAAAHPDLTIWLDLDPELALRRIEVGSLRGVVDKREYFETDALQRRLCEGYRQLLADGGSLPPPFHRGEVVGPITNHAGERELRWSLRPVLRAFLHRRPMPLNVPAEAVDVALIDRLVNLPRDQQLPRGQQRLEVARADPAATWLGGHAPVALLGRLLDAWSAESAGPASVPLLPLHRSVASIVGTLELVGSSELSALRRRLGPVRMVSSRHTQRLVRFLVDQGICQRGSRQGHDGAPPEVAPEWFGIGRLLLAIWPVLPALASHLHQHGRPPARTAMRDILNSGEHATQLGDRLAVLGSGDGGDLPATSDELSSWWSGRAGSG